MSDATDAQLRQERVHWLCCAYPYMPPGRLLRLVEQEIRALDDTRAGRHSLTVGRDLLETTGWAHLLRACLLQDLGRALPARMETALADSLGRESGQTILRHWARELRVWATEDAGDWPAAAQLAAAAVARCGPSNVGVQLLVHDALCSARTGDLARMHTALGQAAVTLAGLEAPVNSEHHFCFDPDKLAHYATMVYGAAGVWQEMLPYATASIQGAVASRTRSDGRTEDVVIRPLRLASAQAEMAHRAAFFGALDTALELAGRALAHTRQCATVVQRVAEVEPVLADRWPREQRVKEFRLRLFEARHRLAMAGG